MTLRTTKPSGAFHRLWMPLMVSGGFAAVVFACLWGFGRWNPLEIDTATANGVAHKALCCVGVAVLLGALIFVLSREALCVHREKVQHAAWYYPLLSGLLSLAAMCVAYSFVGMWPFGEKTGMAVDMHHQYAPLLSGLRDAILNGGSPLYSFEVGLGANYMSLFAYYLASPFNLLLTLFPENLLAEGILLITLLKNAITGALFAFCVQQVFRKQTLVIPAVSVMYSLMMYLLAYSWNVMWLDVVMVLPLVVYGFERLMHTGKYLTYVLSLAYALYANYYLAFMLCVFLVLYYVTYCVCAQRTGNQIGVSFARFAGYSVLAAGLVAVLLVPVYFALKLTSAAGDGLPAINSTRDMFELLGRHLAGTSPTIRSGNLPNLYCGVLAAIGVPLFALNRGIPLRRRVAFVGLWLALAFSFLVNWSDLLWHGLHSPNDLPYRYSFLYSFVLLLMLYETLLHVKEITVKQVFAVCAGLVAYLVIEERFGAEEYNFQVVYVNLALIAIYTGILALAAHRRLRRRLAYAMLLLAVTAEMMFAGGNAILEVNRNEYFTRHDDYVDNELTTALHAAVEKAQALGDEKLGEDFYRLEFVPRRTCVDTALFHYRGITNFASSNYYTTTKLMGGLGYAINGVNSHLYHSFVPFTDSLFGVRYFITHSNIANHPQLQQRATVTAAETTLYVYENQDALGLGCVVDSAVKEYYYSKYNPLGSQEDLYGMLTDTYLPLYELNGFTAEEGTGASVTYPFPGFRVDPQGEGAGAYFTATVEKAGQVFVFADCMAAESMTVSCGENSWQASPNEPYILDVGVQQAGTEITLLVSAEQSCTGNFYVATLNEEAYRQGMDVISANPLTVTALEGNRVTGTVTSSLDGTMMTSIPYDAGWTVRVDGTVVETFAIGEGLLGFDVAAGKHTVELVYYPRGLWVGLGISSVALLVLLLMLVCRPRRKKSAKPTEYLDYDTALPIQEGFVASPLVLTEERPLPATFEELTAETPSDNTTPPVVEPTAEDDEPPAPKEE